MKNETVYDRFVLGRKIIFSCENPTEDENKKNLQKKPFGMFQI